MKIPRLEILLFVVLTTVSLVPSARAQEPTPTPVTRPTDVGAQAAYLVVDHLVWREKDGQILSRSLGRPALLVTTSYGFTLAAVRDGTAFRLIDRDSGEGPIPLEVADFNGRAVPTTDEQANAYNWWLLTGSEGSDLRVDGRYELTIQYDRVPTWAWDADAKAVPSGAFVAVRLLPVPLPDGKKVDNSGNVVEADKGAAGVSGLPPRRAGLFGWIDAVDVEIAPFAAEDTDELGLAYRAAYEIDRMHFGGRIPGNFSIDLAVDGRATTDSSSNSLTGYSSGDLNLRAIWLPGRERYYPLGVRAAAGYEGGEGGAPIESRVTGQVVASVPYVGGVLEAWQQALDFHRAFAPPFVSAGFVGSEAEVAGTDQDRWELEAAWTAPLATEWDFNVRWQYYAFTDSGATDEQLFTADLTFYPDGDVAKGIRMSFEDGYRAAVGDIGSRFLLGYKIEL